MTTDTYEKFLEDILTNGATKTDRTGTGTCSRFGMQMRFDLQEGFPLITTKKLHTKSIIQELLWFVKGNSNAKWLQERGVRIWNEWAPENGELGPVYGTSWRAIYSPSNRVIEVEKHHDLNAGFAYAYSDLLPAIPHYLNSEESWAIEDLGNDSYKVQFASGYIRVFNEQVEWQESSEYDDGYYKRVAGVGFNGVAEYPFNSDDVRLLELWESIIERCYNETHPLYERYGAKGITVSPIWHSFEYFAQSVSEVPGYYKWKEDNNLELTSEYLLSDVLSPTTAVFLPPTHSLDLLNADGTVYEIQGKKFATILDWARGHKGEAEFAQQAWASGYPYGSVDAEEVTRVSATPGKAWRKQLYVDQLTDVIEQIKATPDSRRLIVMAWNPPALPDQALPPCHAFFQFYVADGKLSLQLYQRSADAFLGVPFNIASYAFLLHMVAQQTDLEVGDFVWTGGDCHIYSNHFEQVKTQISRTPYKFPKLELKKRDSIYEYEYEDFTIVGYESHPHIKGMVAV
jgi:thymidylate synthase